MKLKKITAICFGLCIIALSAFSLTTSNASNSTSTISNILNPFIKGLEKKEIVKEQTTTWKPNNTTNKDNIIKTVQINDANSKNCDIAKTSNDNITSDLSNAADKSETNIANTSKNVKNINNKTSKSEDQQSKVNNKEVSNKKQTTNKITISSVSKQNNNNAQVNTNSSKNSSVSNSVNSTSSNNTTASNPYGCTDEEYSVFLKINQFRREHGLHELTWSDELYRVGKIRSNELVETFSHYRPDGSYYTSVTPIPYYENIGAGYKNAQAAFDGWKYSPAHCNQMLRSNITSCAIALQTGNTVYKYYWTCLLEKN